MFYLLRIVACLCQWYTWKLRKSISEIFKMFEIISCPQFQWPSLSIEEIFQKSFELLYFNVTLIIESLDMLMAR